MRAKKWLCTLTCAALLAAPTAAFADSTDLTLLINGGQVGGDDKIGQPYINNAGRTMIPLRMVNEVLGYTTEWHNDGTVRIIEQGGDVNVTIKIGSLDYVAGDKAGKFETAPLLKNNRTYIPARDFSKLYGDIYWDNDTRTVWVSDCDKTDYQVIGKKLFRSDETGIHQLTMPEGRTIAGKMVSEPIAFERNIDGVNYVAVMEKSDWVGKVPLYRDNGTGLEYLTDIYGSASVWVEGETVYYTDGNMAGGWGYKPDYNRLTVTTLGPNGTTKEYKVDFNISVCELEMEMGKLIAEEPNGTEHDLSHLF